MFLQYRHMSHRSLSAAIPLVLCTLLGTKAFAFTLPSDAEAVLKNCMAAQSDSAPPVKKKNGPAKYLVKGVTQELSSNAKGIGEGLVFVFSAQDLDPYNKSAPTDKPYTALSVALVDGTTCDVIKYPDGSAKVAGGFADDTIIAPLDAKTFVVGYPNGARGEMVKIGQSYKIYRPDDSVTTIEKTMSGRYSITNDRLGYMGDAMSDRTGLSYEFSRPLD